MIPLRERPRIAWGRAPLLLPVVMLCLGIALADYLDHRLTDTFGWFTLGVGLGLLLTYSVKTLHLRPRLLGMLVLPLYVLFGAWYAGVRHPLADERHLIHAPPSEAIVGQVSNVKTGKRWTTEIEVQTVLSADTIRNTRGKVLAYLDGPRPLTGQRLLLAAPLDTVRPPPNPAMFDYAAYLAGRGIYHRTFADSSQWRVIEERGPLTLKSIGESIRDRWFASLTPHLSGDELAVAVALIMGKRDLLGTELRSAYADTGAIHVLAVSGLHVGIVALIVMQLLGICLPDRWGLRWVRTLLTIAAIWLFALVTGLSPSVQRAALMISVVLIGRLTQRNNSLYNLLAIAALFMLVANPRQLFQVGFQLSFAAVVGIGLFLQPLRKLVHLPGKLGYVWDAISVSSAAQLGTLPLSLYYFGQIPLYFMLSGTLVIVFAYGVLALGLAHGLLATVGLGGLAITGTLLDWLVGRQNAMINLCRQLPGATLQFPNFDLVSVVVAYLTIGTLAYLCFRPSHRGRWALMASAGMLAGLWLLRPALYPPSPQFVIYHLPYASLIDVYDGRGGISIGDSVPARQLEYSVLPFRRQLGLRSERPVVWRCDTSTNAASLRYPLVRILDRTVQLVDSTYAKPVSEVDIALIRHGRRPAGVEISDGVDIVVDGSNPPWVGRLWKQAYPRAHVTATDGAYRYLDD